MEDRIFLSELALLGLWLASPALIVGLAMQGVILWHRGLGRPGLRLRLALVVFLSGLLSYVLTFVIWTGVPQRLMTWPGESGDWPFMFLGVFFVPAVLAVIVVCPIVSWYVLWKWASNPPSG